jgi:hypothetical protein
MADVGFLENHKLRFTMPLSARSRCDPHEYTVRVTPDIVERATAMVSKEIECACDFCECLVVTSRARAQLREHQVFPGVPRGERPKE